MATFTGNEGEDFPLDIAAKWTANYRVANPTGIKAYFFGHKILHQLLKQQNCVGIRMYYALDDVGVQQMILVGVDAAGNDLYQGIVGDRGAPCPPYCDTNNSPLLK